MWASQVVPVVKNLSANAGDTEDAGFDLCVQEGMTTHSSILAWRIPADRGVWWATAHGVAKCQTQASDLAHTCTHTRETNNKAI